MSKEYYDDFCIGSNPNESEKKSPKKVKEKKVVNPNKKPNAFSEYFDFVRTNLLMYILCLAFSSITTFLFTFSQAIVLRNLFVLIFLDVLFFVVTCVLTVFFNRKLITKYVSQSKTKNSFVPVFHLIVVLLAPALLLVLFLLVFSLIKPESALLCGGLLPFILGIVFYLLMIASTFLQKLDYYISMIEEKFKKIKKKK